MSICSYNQHNQSNRSLALVEDGVYASAHFERLFDGSESENSHDLQIEADVAPLPLTVVSAGPGEINPATGKAFTAMETSDLLFDIVDATFNGLPKDVTDHELPDTIIALVRVVATLLAPYLHVEADPDARLGLIADACTTEDTATDDPAMEVAAHVLLWSEWLPGPDWSVPSRVWVDWEDLFTATPCWTSPSGVVYLDWIDFGPRRYSRSVAVPEVYFRGRDVFVDDFAGVRHIVTGDRDGCRWFPEPDVCGALKYAPHHEGLPNEAA